MDISIALTGIVLPLIIIVPIILAHIKREREEKAFIKKLERTAGAQNIQHYDLWNTYAIAVTNSGTLCYLKNIAENVLIVNVSELKNCRIINSGKELNSITTNIHTISRLELELTKTDNTVIKLLFFDHTINFHVNEEIRLIKKWNEIINKRIAN